MDKINSSEQKQNLELAVSAAKLGDRDALVSVVRAVQQDIYGIALRFLWHPQDAEDATQEILIRIITGLGTFEGNSSFNTWVYRVATNTMLTLNKKRMEQQTMTFAEFGTDLEQHLSDIEMQNVYNGPAESLLLEEVKIGCTLAMLLCLDRNHRLAYILGEILELEHQQACEVLEIGAATFRKRLSRARNDITALITSRCGLANPSNQCRCRRRVSTAIRLGRVDPDNLLFAASLEQAQKFPAVLTEIRNLEETRRAASLYRSQSIPQPSEAFVKWLRGLINQRYQPS